MKRQVALSSGGHLVMEGRQCGDKADGMAESTTDKLNWSLDGHYGGHFNM